MQWFKLYFLMNLFSTASNNGNYFKANFIGLFWRALGLFSLIDSLWPPVVPVKVPGQSQDPEMVSLVIMEMYFFTIITDFLSSVTCLGNQILSLSTEVCFVGSTIYLRPTWGSLDQQLLSKMMQLVFY